MSLSLICCASREVRSKGRLWPRRRRPRLPDTAPGRVEWGQRLAALNSPATAAAHSGPQEKPGPSWAPHRHGNRAGPCDRDRWSNPTRQSWRRDSNPRGSSPVIVHPRATAGRSRRQHLDQARLDLLETGVGAVERLALMRRVEPRRVARAPRQRHDHPRLVHHLLDRLSGAQRCVMRNRLARDVEVFVGTGRIGRPRSSAAHRRSPYARVAASCLRGAECAAEEAGRIREGRAALEHVGADAVCAQDPDRDPVAAGAPGLRLDVAPVWIGAAPAGARPAQDARPAGVTAATLPTAGVRCSASSSNSSTRVR